MSKNKSPQQTQAVLAGKEAQLGSVKPATKHATKHSRLFVSLLPPNFQNYPRYVTYDVENFAECFRRTHLKHDEWQRGKRTFEMWPGTGIPKVAGLCETSNSTTALQAAAGRGRLVGLLPAVDKLDRENSAFIASFESVLTELDKERSSRVELEQRQVEMEAKLVAMDTKWKELMENQLEQKTEFEQRLEEVLQKIDGIQQGLEDLHQKQSKPSVPGVHQGNSIGTSMTSNTRDAGQQTTGHADIELPGTGVHINNHQSTTLEYTSTPQIDKEEETPFQAASMKRLLAFKALARMDSSLMGALDFGQKSESPKEMKVKGASPESVVQSADVFHEATNDGHPNEVPDSKEIIESRDGSEKTSERKSEASEASAVVSAAPISSSRGSPMKGILINRSAHRAAAVYSKLNQKRISSPQAASAATSQSVVPIHKKSDSNDNALSGKEVIDRKTFAEDDVPTLSHDASSPASAANIGRIDAPIVIIDTDDESADDGENVSASLDGGISCRKEKAHRTPRLDNSPQPFFDDKDGDDIDKKPPEPRRKRKPEGPFRFADADVEIPSVKRRANPHLSSSSPITSRSPSTNPGINMPNKISKLSS
ncbi:hypothetical protein FA10DRAFT_288941 [Acaromyces ingoldii]|uniref:Uncharacterized protein n=1 Tax=Acaromyces ingoldii TaxID=215250 RepID=A0A316YEA1_9BASI|nr:hypothetical protein FA10DRAFT_288941 [Acaromyces ingoldii]PWN87522.1 hypothetical protein FA10DRAFT_288941 [Acaromyces ingoldii]